MNPPKFNLDDPNFIQYAVECLGRIFTRKKTLSDIIASTRYYAAVEAYSENSNFRVWRDPRLYFGPETTPTRHETSGCLGIVWLHNPSARFQPASPPGVWGEIRILRPDEPDHNTLNYVIGVVGMALKAVKHTVPGSARPHVRLEELVYLDSEGREHLWDGLTDEQIDQHSHTCVLDAGNPGFRVQQPKLIWLAWGDLRTRLAREQNFNRLASLAQQSALQSSADTIFVAEVSTPSGPITPTFQFSQKHQMWIMRWRGGVYENKHPNNWDIRLHPPIHPETLRRSDYHVAIQKDLAAAISSALT